MDWQDDPVCEFVICEILEGISIDGVTEEVVDSLVPQGHGRRDESLKTNFVAQCALCHPVYEALKIYQRSDA